MYKTDSDVCDNCLDNFNVVEEYTERHINKLENLLKRLEVFGFIELAIK